MNGQQNFLGLPKLGLNLLLGGGGFFLICLGVNAVRASEIAVKVANTQLVSTNSADKLEEAAQKLKEQAEVIEQKDQAYEELQHTYNEYLHNRRGDIELGEAIEAIDDLPDVENIEEIKNEISDTEQLLLEEVGK